MANVHVVVRALIKHAERNHDQRWAHEQAKQTGERAWNAAKLHPDRH
jgi:hypothetical protein